MPRKTEPDLFAALRKIDTPTITNVVATYPTNPICLGLYNPWSENWYTDTSIRCMYPELGAVAGYAVTCVYSVPDPNYNRLTFMDVVDARDLAAGNAGAASAGAGAREVVVGAGECVDDVVVAAVGKRGQLVEDVAGVPAADDLQVAVFGCGRERAGADLF